MVTKPFFLAALLSAVLGLSACVNPQQVELL
jgi:hypothetical protein